MVKETKAVITAASVQRRLHAAWSGLERQRSPTRGAGEAAAEPPLLKAAARLWTKATAAAAVAAAQAAAAAVVRVAESAERQREKGGRSRLGSG